MPQHRNFLAPQPKTKIAGGAKKFRCGANKNFARKQSFGHISSEIIRTPLAIPPLGVGGEILSKLKTGKNLKDLKKGKEKGGKEKKKRVIKHTFKYLYEAKIPQKIHKNREEF